MFDYSIKVKVALVGALIVLIVALIVLTNNNNSRSRDLEMVTQVRGLATAMENYFDKNFVYPEMDKTKLVNIQVVTENGVNQKGDYLYFKSLDWMRKGSLSSTKERYIIEFELDNSWDIWNIDNRKGGNCRVSNYLEMICQNK